MILSLFCPAALLEKTTESWGTQSWGKAALCGLFPFVGCAALGNREPRTVLRD
jgi:hypothetical protein